MANSGNESTGKMFPAATVEDSERKERGMEMNPITISTPPFSSRDPRTDGIRMEPLLEGEAAEAAYVEPDDADKNSDDWKRAVDGASNQDELDAVVSRYEESGADYKSVTAAIDKKQEELDAAESGDDNS